MKTKFTLLTFLTLFITLFNATVFAYGDHIDCDHPPPFYCQYQGGFNNLNPGGFDEEFMMLLEEKDHPNFTHIMEALLFVFGHADICPVCMELLKNSECDVSNYIKQFLKFYAANKERIKENLGKDLGDEGIDTVGLKIAEMFDQFEEKLHEEFLNEAIELSKNHATLSHVNSFANSGYHRENCDFHGWGEHNEPEREEFARLFADRKSEFFRKISATIAQLATTEPSVLNDPVCPIYRYARAFLDYYNENKKRIPKDKLYITKILDIVQETTQETEQQEKPDL